MVKRRRRKEWKYRSGMEQRKKKEIVYSSKMTRSHEDRLWGSQSERMKSSTSLVSIRRFVAWMSFLEILWWLDNGLQAISGSISSNKKIISCLVRRRQQRRCEKNWKRAQRIGSCVLVYLNSQLIHLTTFEESVWEKEITSTVPFFSHHLCFVQQFRYVLVLL